MDDSEQSQDELSGGRPKTLWLVVVVLVLNSPLLAGMVGSIVSVALGHSRIASFVAAAVCFLALAFCVASAFSLRSLTSSSRKRALVIALLSVAAWLALLVMSAGMFNVRNANGEADIASPIVSVMLAGFVFFVGWPPLGYVIWYLLSPEITRRFSLEK